MDFSTSSVFFLAGKISFLVAVAATVSCFLIAGAFIFRRVNSGPNPESENQIPRESEEMTVGLSGGGPAAEDSQAGMSMMEQLVPEITSHVLGYLDHRSLCRLAMTSSLMRKAANDDNPWKAVYFKDFTLEQETITPPNGWKAYYVATRAIVNTNSEFFRIIRERSLQAMAQFWLNADYVKCVHASGDSFSGYNAVIESWQEVFRWQHVASLQIREVRSRVLSDVAWVTMTVFVDFPFNVTNVYEFHDGKWCMVHHHTTTLFVRVGGEM
ncbi:nuclear transport factor 2 family protein [Striga asiatica]|uniref:Nuclear transport factor 2 family protein n=1 Tax=Striga asiatica TaxID=4170 RepID=A0A5A7RK76_STRAF|nr:nuclear transport factor 2 family protein [Striga asiatica]